MQLLPWFSSFFSCPRRRTSESKQKNDISINNWTFRYAFFGFLCFKNAKTQQEIFSVCFLYVSSSKSRESALCTLGKMSAQIHSICISMCNKILQLMFLCHYYFSFFFLLLMCTIRKSNWIFVLVHRWFYFLFFDYVFHQCPLNINVFVYSKCVRRTVYTINENNHHAAIESVTADADEELNHWIKFENTMKKLHTWMHFTAWDRIRTSIVSECRINSSNAITYKKLNHTRWTSVRPGINLFSILGT